MKVGKAVGPNSIPVEIWKSLGEEGIEWLTDLFNIILKTERCHKNEDIVPSSHCTRITEMLKTATTDTNN